MAQYLNNPSLGVSPFFGPPLDFHHHFVPFSGAQCILPGNEYVVKNPRVVRHHKPKIPAFLVGAHHPPVGPFQDAHNLPLGLAAVNPALCYLGDNPVVVHRAVNPVGGNIHVLVHIVPGQHKTKTPLMALQSTRYEVHFFRYTVPFLAGEYNLPFPFHFPEGFAKCRHIRPINIKPVHQLLRRHRVVRLFFHEFQNSFLKLQAVLTSIHAPVHRGKTILIYY